MFRPTGREGSTVHARTLRAALAVAASLAALGAAAGVRAFAVASPPALIFASDRGHDYLPEVYAVSLASGARVDASRNPQGQDTLLTIDRRTGMALLASDRDGHWALYATSGLPGAAVRLLAPLPQRVTGVGTAWSDGGVVAVSASAGSEELLLVVTNGGRLLSLREGVEARAAGIAGDTSPLSADGQMLAFAAAKWQPKPQLTVVATHGSASWRMPGTEATWAADAPRVAITNPPASVGRPSTSLLCDEQGRVLGHFSGEADALSPDGRLLVLSRGKSGAVLASQSGRVRGRFAGSMRGASFSADGRYVALYGWNDTTRIVSAASGHVVAWLSSGWTEWLAGDRLLETAQRPVGPPTLTLMSTSGRALRRLPLGESDEWLGGFVRADPSGTRVLYTLQGMHIHQLYEQLPSGGLRQLTHGWTDHTQPAVSPDGSRLADIEYGAPCGNCIQQAAILPLDGSSSPATLKTYAYVEGHPTWSPDGSSLAVEENDASYEGIVVEQADGSASRTLAAGAGGRGPAWSPDGTLIAFSNDAGLQVMPPDGSQARLVTSTSALQGAHINPGSTWAPDSRSLAFAASDGIWVVAADGTGLRRILAMKGVSSVAWSPDGSTIALSASCRPACGGDAIWTVHADGGDLTRITHDASDDTTPTWLPAP
jgi:Tol biopolymer transport system component